MINVNVNQKEVQDFIEKFKTQFLPKLQERLDNDPKNRGGKIIYAGNAQASCGGIDVQIEDKNGNVSLFNVDPINQTFAPVVGTF